MLKSSIDKQIDDILKMGISTKTIDYLSKLIDIKKDIALMSDDEHVKDIIGDIMFIERSGGNADERKAKINKLLNDSKMIRDALSEASLSPEQKANFLNIFKA